MFLTGAGGLGAAELGFGGGGAVVVTTITGDVGLTGAARFVGLFFGAALCVGLCVSVVGSLGSGLLAVGLGTGADDVAGWLDAASVRTGPPGPPRGAARATGG